MIWILIGAGLLVTLYCFFVISGENVYQVTYHDPNGKQWKIMVSATDQKGAIETTAKVTEEGSEIVKVEEVL